jgi:hypothetical protein
MTRIKKRRSGKKKTSDQQRSAAGKRRARSAANAAPAPKEQDAANEPTAKKTISYKKKFKAFAGGRRGARAVQKEAVAKEKKFTDKLEAKKEKTLLGGKSFAEPAKSTGKTRSAGSRRIAAAKSVATNFKGKLNNKKILPQKKEAAAEGKAPKGFAPWNKNKFKRKDKGL